MTQSSLKHTKGCPIATVQRRSSPKLQVYNTALLTATAGFTLEEARANRVFRGHLLESAVGAHLANAAAAGDIRLFYWRDGSQEVDFVVQQGRRVVAIEVKSEKAPHAHAGTAAFRAAFKTHRALLVGGDGVPAEEFLAQPVSYWTRA